MGVVAQLVVVWGCVCLCVCVWLCLDVKYNFAGLLSIMKLLLLAATLGGTVEAFAVGEIMAKATALVVSHVAAAHEPKMTTPPSVEELDLRRRQSDNPWACGTGWYCAYKITEGGGNMGCVNSVTYFAKLGCYDSSAVAASSCDSYCSQDSHTLKCTSTSLSYCGTVTLSQGVQDYFCDSVSHTAPIQLYTAYLGESSRAFLSTEIADTPTTVSTTQDSSTSESSTTSSSSYSSTSTNSVATESPVPPSTPTGAIAGGVVGGVAVIALIGFGIWFMMRRRKNAAAPPTTTAWSNQPYAGHPSQPAAPGPYSPTAPMHPQMAAGGAYFVPPEQAKSPAMSQTSNAYHRDSMLSTVSPTSSAPPYQPPLANYSMPTGNASGPNNIPPTVHEAGGDAVGSNGQKGNHHGEIYEM
ncbi:hypothetical protein BX600DRAFT_525283 [Xylariales sp. PMI_506]|nr:hypothetical protein BX600DRAFT_525283 [Xylariales sp. PMI_506]